MLRVAVITRTVCEPLINGGLLSVSIVPSVAFRQGARVAGTTTAVNAGRHLAVLFSFVNEYKTMHYSIPRFSWQTFLDTLTLTATIALNSLLVTSSFIYLENTRERRRERQKNLTFPIEPNQDDETACPRFL